jgi:hypothetical protein
MTTNLHKLTGPAPLLLRYSGQSNPQNAYVEVYAFGSVCYYADPEIGNGRSASVFHGVARRWLIPEDLTARGYESLHSDIEDMLQRVSAGLTTRWDGNNTVGCLSEDASNASDELEEYLRNCWQNDYERDQEYLAEVQS